MTGTLLNRFAAVLAPLALLSVSACTQTFDAKVKRFEAGLPAPAGQSFAIVSDDPALAGGIEFSQYARLVDAQMVRLGYTPSDTAHAANRVGQSLVISSVRLSPATKKSSPNVAVASVSCASNH